jgi:hypothetical protein
LNAHGLKFHIAVFGWLVALTILKQYESQWEGWHPIYYGKIIFHTTNQLGVNKSASCSTMPLIFSTRDGSIDSISSSSGLISMFYGSMSSMPAFCCYTQFQQLGPN